MTRSFAQPRPIHILADADGQPRQVVWRGQREAVRVCNTWRDEQGWWSGRLPRTYFKLLTRSRAILVVYQEETRWYVERVVD